MIAFLATSSALNPPASQTLFDRLLGLQSLSTGAESVALEFARPLPAWVWVGIAALCFAIAGWSYWRLLGPRSARICLASLRGGVLLILALLISGPQLVLPNERIEKDWVVVMADRSTSMTIADVEGPQPTTRDAQLRTMLDAHAGLFSDLAARRNVLFTGFDLQSFDLQVTPATATAPLAVDIGAPTGTRTLISQSIEQALGRLAARPVAAFILFSDGASPDQPTRTLLRQLEARRIPVFTVPLGNPDSPADLALTRVDAPPAAFIGDKIPIAVEIDLLLPALKVNPSLAPDAPQTVRSIEAQVQVIDTADGSIVAERTIPVSADARTARTILQVSRPLPGTARYKVQVLGPVADLSAANNAQEVTIDISDRPIRVLYFDGYPRWEYRYLKNILVREQSIRSVAMILDPQRRFIQDGSEVLDALPRTQEDWNRFDVIIMGDVLPSVFTTEQLEQIKNVVAMRGSGLLWIGGSGPTPGAWLSTPLADLLPFVLSATQTSERTVPAWLSPILIKPTALAQQYGVLELSANPAEPWPAELLDSDLGWPLMRWAQRFSPDMLKPTAQVLATASPVSSASSTADAPPADPLVMAMRYGAGRVVYVGTDETWRYRYCRGEVLSERFWIPLVRLLARESLGRTGKPALLVASPQQVRVGQDVQITANVLDQRLLQGRPTSLRATVQRLPPTSLDTPAPFTPPPVGLTLARTSPDQQSAQVKDDGATAAFTSSWTASAPGQYTVELAEDFSSASSDAREEPIQARFDVIAPDDELRSPQTDHPALASLAAATGGQMLTGERLAELNTLIPNREVRLLAAPDIETLWDKPIVWALIIFMLIIEWVWRRLLKLA